MKCKTEICNFQKLINSKSIKLHLELFFHFVGNDFPFLRMNWNLHEFIHRKRIYVQSMMMAVF